MLVKRQVGIVLNLERGSTLVDEREKEVDPKSTN